MKYLSKQGHVMVDNILNYVIVSCIFNVFYYYFNCSDKINKYVNNNIDRMVREIEKRDPFNPFIKDLKKKKTENSQSQLSIPFKIFSDLIFFPFNLLIMVFLFLDYLGRKK